VTDAASAALDVLRSALSAAVSATAARPFQRVKGLAIVSAGFFGLGARGEALRATEEAAKGLGRVRKPDEKEIVERLVAFAFARLGRLERVRKMLRDGLHPVTLVNQLADDDLPGPAEEMLAEADPEDRAGLLWRIGGAYARTGDVPSARRIAESLPDGRDRALVDAAIARRLAEAGDIDGAFAAAPVWEFRVWERVVVRHFETGHYAAAVAVARDCRNRFADDIINVEFGFRKLVDIAAAFAREGRVTEAVELLDDVLACAGCRVRGFAALSALRRSVGDGAGAARFLARAKGIAESYPNAFPEREFPPTADEGRFEMVAALAEFGDPDTAEALAERLPEGDWRVRGRAACAAARYPTLSDDTDRERVVREVLRDYVGLGEIEEERVHTDVAAFLVKAGRFDKLPTVTDRLEHEFQKRDLLVNAVVVALRAHGPGVTRAWIESHPDPMLRVNALVHLARLMPTHAREGPALNP
jgi:hypothetical protein